MKRFNFLDMDGDGKTDIYYIEGNIDGTFILDSVYLSIGKGKFQRTFGVSTKLGPGILMAELDINRIRFGDFNGDGLMDVYVINGFNSRIAVKDSIYLNMGCGNWTLPQDGLLTKIRGNIYEAGFDLRRIAMLEINQDSMTDIFVIHSEVVVDDIFYLSKGNCKFIPIPTKNKLPISEITKIGNLDLSRIKIGDFDGSGYPSLLWISSGKSIPLTIYKNKFMQPMLTKVIDGLNFETKLYYLPLTNKEVYSSRSELGKPLPQFPLRSISLSIYVVSRMNNTNGLEKSYFYQNALYHLEGIGYLGFEKVIHRDLLTDVSLVMEYSQDYKKYLRPQILHKTKILGLDSEEEITVGDIKYVLRAETWKSQFDTCTFYSVVTSKKFEISNDITGKFVSSHAAKMIWDEYLNPIYYQTVEKDKFGIVTTTKNIKYLHFLSEWIVNLPIEVIVTSSVGGEYYVKSSSTITTSFLYDNYTHLMIKKTEFPTSVKFCKITNFGYDIFGNEVLVSSHKCDGSSRRTISTQYENRGRWISSVTNPLGFVEKFVQDPYFGITLNHISVSGLETQREIDLHGNIVEENIIQKNNIINYKFVWCDNAWVEDLCPDNGPYVVQAVMNTGSKSYSVYDNRKRIIREVKKSFDGSLIFIDTEYTVHGQISKKMNPYFFKNSHNEIYYKSYEYDNLQLLSKMIDIDGGITKFSYKGTSVDTISPLGQMSQLNNNLLQHPVRIVDPDNNVMIHKYDATGNCVDTVDTKGNHFRATFNERGNKIRDFDPNRGYNTYNYDFYGNLIKLETSNSQRLYYYHDDLNRVINKHSSDGVKFNWKYDTLIHGKLASVRGTMRGGNYSASYDYGKNLNVARETVVIDGITYSTINSYDKFSRLNKVQYDDGFSYCIKYNGNGFTSAFTDCKDTKVYMKVLEMDEFGDLN